VQEADVMLQQLEGAQRDRAALAATKTRLAAAERQGRARDWELEVTQQQLEKVGEGAAPQTAAAGLHLLLSFWLSSCCCWVRCGWLGQDVLP
jgi:hypothetical protein